MGSPGNIAFSSVLNSGYRGALERLLFFNGRQAIFSQAISRSIEALGAPEIIAEDGSLRIVIGSRLLTQSIYAFEENGDSRDLIGVIIYSRTSPEDITVVHIAVSEDYSCEGERADRVLVLHLVNRVREIARRLKGVKTIRLSYWKDMNRVGSIPVKG